MNGHDSRDTMNDHDSRDAIMPTIHVMPWMATIHVMPWMALPENRVVRSTLQHIDIQQTKDVTLRQSKIPVS